MSGTIQSPYYPRFYPYNSHCRYLIENWYPAARITLRFLRFKIESYDLCRDDYVKVYDGNTTESPLLGSQHGYCGFYWTLPILTSTGNAVLVIFVSNNRGITDGLGFDISYSIKGTFNLFISSMTSFEILGVPKKVLRLIYTKKRLLFNSQNFFVLNKAYLNLESEIKIVEIG